MSHVLVTMESEEEFFFNSQSQKDMGKSAPNIVPDSTPDSVPDSTPDSVPDSAPDSVPDSTPDSVPDSVPESAPDSVPDSAPDSVPDSAQNSGQKNTGESVIEYFFVVVFEINVDLRNPFQCYVLEIFQEDDIPSSWITGPLEAKFRVIEREFNCLRGRKFNVFCKIEKGIFLRGRSFICISRYLYVSSQEPRY